MSSSVKSTAAAIGIMFFIVGLFLMAIAEHVDIVFGIGLLMFLISIIMGMTSFIWGIAGTADRALNRFTDGGSDK